jgi:membrane-bound lytic murein transglycosylase MltF
MDIRQHILKWIRNIILAMVLLMIVPKSERARITNSSSQNPFAGKHLTCAIYLSNETTSKQGLETGYNYALLQRFTKDNHCTATLRVRENEHYLDSLNEGNIDLYIARKDEIQKTDSISVSNVLDDLYVWAVGDDSSREKVKSLNNWLRHIAHSKENIERRERFRGSFNPFRLAEKGAIRDRVSPYDILIKEYAAELGWDWRMLAAVLYQESRFSIKAESHRGAKGLMQIMPVVARKYGIQDLIDPQQNIAAGTRILSKLQGNWKSEGLSDEECIKFTLASYNAGEARIHDCRNLAEAKGKDHNCWDAVVEVIPLMREDSILEEEAVKLGKFQGSETIKYVDNVMALYNAICTIHPTN